jgi:2-polyprenyl-3-methyl-5-hydroxy-6-metoxy-1,4-benzoquinol methylase
MRIFDVVLLIDVIEHLFGTDRAIAEIRKVLRKDSFLVISTPNLSSFANRLLLLFGYQPLGTEVSTHKHYGRPKKYNLREGVAGHLRMFS